MDEPRDGRVHVRLMDTIGRRIVAGGYKESHPLPIEHILAHEFGVSRGALREAVKALAAKGLLSVGPRSGTRVRPRASWNYLDPDVILWCDDADPQRVTTQLTELRAIVEPGAAALAATKATSEQRAALAEAFERMKTATDFLDYLEADLAFHSLILEASQNDLLSSLTLVLDLPLRTSIQRSAAAPGAVEASLRQHELVLAAVLAADPQSAQSAAARLIEIAAHDLQGGFDQPLDVRGAEEL